MRDDLAALRPVLGCLGRLGIEHYVGGSVASSVHGVARTTLDVDVIAAVQRRHVEAIASALRDDYYVDAQQILAAVEARRAFNVIHLATMYKIDVFVMGDRAFDRSARRRTSLEAIDEGEAPVAVASAEDVVLSKLEWYRLGGESSERQWFDVVGVMRVQDARLDWSYLERWAGELGVLDLLQGARAASSESS